MTQTDQSQEEYMDLTPKKEEQADSNVNEGNSLGFDMGLPSSEDYNKGMEKAFGF